MYLEEQSDVSHFSGWIVLKNSPEIRALLGGYVGGAKNTHDMTDFTSQTYHIWYMSFSALHMSRVIFFP